MPRKLFPLSGCSCRCCLQSERRLSISCTINWNLPFQVSSALVVTVVRLGYLWKVAAPLSTAVEDAFSSKVHARRGKGPLAEHLIFVKQSLSRIHAATCGAVPRISSLNAVELSVCVASLSGSSKGGELSKHKTMIE
jgi:hypothetical protein